MKQFEVGHKYCNDASKRLPVEIVKRTAKYVWVSHGDFVVKMLIRIGPDGNEYLRDGGLTKLSPLFTEHFTFHATNEAK